jgi:predicted GTPase
VLLHVIDAAAGEPEEQFRQINKELAAYGAGLDERPQAVVLNKTDLLQEEPVFELDDERVVGVFCVSAATGAGVEELKRRLFGLVPAAPPPRVDPEGLAEFLVYRPQPRAATFRILRTDRGFRVLGSPPSPDELEEALRAAGARAGSEIEVGDETRVLE